MFVQPHQGKALAEIWKKWLNKGLHWKIIKIRTTSVLISHPKQVRTAYKRCLIFTVSGGRIKSHHLPLHTVNPHGKMKVWTWCKTQINSAVGAATAVLGLSTIRLGYPLCAPFCPACLSRAQEIEDSTFLIYECWTLSERPKIATKSKQGRYLEATDSGTFAQTRISSVLTWPPRISTILRVVRKNSYGFVGKKKKKNVATKREKWPYGI